MTRAADALFNVPPPEADASDAKSLMIVGAAALSDETKRKSGRILQAIEPVQQEEAARPANVVVRRGRPLGSKNKVKLQNTVGTAPSRSIDVSAAALVDSLFGSEDIETPAEPVPNRTPVIAVVSTERVRSSWRKTDLEPGERWKRRLSRACW